MKTCKQCSKNVKLFIPCFKCDSVYHPKCLGKVPTLYINNQGHVFCCRKETSTQSHYQEKLDTPKEPKREVKEKYSYKRDNGLENRLFKEEEPEERTYKCKDCNLELYKARHLKEHSRKCIKRRRSLKSWNADDNNINGHKRRVKQSKKNVRLKKKETTNADNDKLQENVAEKEKQDLKQCSTSDNKIQYKCTYANGKYEYASIKHSEGDKKYLCEDCEYSTDYKGKLILHLRGHVNKMPFKRVCKRTEAKNPLLEKSLCDICRLAIDGKLHLKCHVLRKYRDEEKKFRCTDCNYSTHFIRDLVLHHSFEKHGDTHNRICNSTSTA